MSFSSESKGILFIVFFFMCISYLIYNTFQTQVGAITVYFCLLGALGWIFMVNYGDWLWFRRGTQVNTLSGISGTQIGQTIIEADGRETRFVSFERRMVAKEVRETYESSWTFVKDILSNTITIPITAKRNLWEQVNDEDLENPNGAIFFHGRIDGADIRNPNYLNGLKKAERLQRILSTIISESKKQEEQLAAISNLKIYDMEKMSQVLKGVADNVKHVQVIAKGGSAGVEAAASEMAQ